jgi:hypothetical protein
MVLLPPTNRPFCDSQHIGFPQLP